jgi:hypothetical protein
LNSSDEHLSMMHHASRNQDPPSLGLSTSNTSEYARAARSPLFCISASIGPVLLAQARSGGASRFERVAPHLD